MSRPKGRGPWGFSSIQIEDHRVNMVPLNNISAAETVTERPPVFEVEYKDAKQTLSSLSKFPPLQLKRQKMQPHPSIVPRPGLTMQQSGLFLSFFLFFFACFK